MVNFGAANSATTGVGGVHPSIDVSSSGLNDPLLVGLRSLGHTVSFATQSSGISTIIRAPSATTGALTLWLVLIHVEKVLHYYGQSF